MSNEFRRPSGQLEPVLISVAMTVYVRAASLVRTLESVVSQMGCDFEFIVIYGGSTDHAGGIQNNCAVRDAEFNGDRR